MLCFTLGLTGCGALRLSDLLTGNTESSTDPIPSTVPILEATNRFALALGGVAPGRDELVLFNIDGTVRQLAPGSLEVFPEDADIVTVEPRPGFDDFATGSGARVVPHAAGTTRIRYRVNGVTATEAFAVVVPPQALVQVLLGEARAQVLAEASIEDGVVTLDSESPTGDTLGAIIRNRIEWIEFYNNPSLFVVDPVLLAADPPASAYTAVIEAAFFGNYQFSPVDPDDLSHDVYLQAAARDSLPTGVQLAYDQAVITAAGIFDGSTQDPTDGAFAFFTPTAEEAECLQLAAQSAAATFPLCVPGDENYPALSPVQVVIDQRVAELAPDHPAFVYYRQRAVADPAVIVQP